jgi:hypothetical protein
MINARQSPTVFNIRVFIIFCIKNKISVKGGKQMKKKWISVLLSAVFLASVPFTGVTAQQGERVKVSEAERQRIEQLAKERADTKDKKPVKQTPAQNKTRIDDSTLKPGEVVPKEIPVGQPSKPKRDPLIR